jgi:plastocyanin
MRINAIGVGLVFVASLTLAGCTEKNGGETSGDVIDMKGFMFNPATKTVKVGTKVTWKNRDGTMHTVDSNGTGPLASGPVQSGQSWSYTFATAGTFEYHCEPHKPGMGGKIIVTA